MSIDPRLKERRRVVAEDHARRNVRRLLRFIAALTLAGGAVWVMLSPLMSVQQISVSGVSASDTREVLEANVVVPGRPLILIRPGTVESQIESNPWVVDATVRLAWPDGVVVNVTERTSAAWVQTSAGWSRRASDGVALPSATQPDETLGWARLSSIDERAAAESPIVLGAIEFIETLPGDLTRDVIVRLEDNGELWAVVSGYQVRLGRPVEMREKALSLAALLEVDPPRGAVLTLVAPTHPAVTPNRSLTDEEGEVAGDQDVSDVEGDGEAGQAGSSQEP